MTPGVRKFTLAVHLTVSIGWIGAVAAYTSLDISTVTSDDAAALRAAYLGMNLIASSVIVPLSLASLATGVVISVGTQWGLFRHYWVLISLVLTILATLVLLVETKTIAGMATIAADPQTSAENLRSLGSTLPHSVGGAVVLVVILVLNLYKPRGLTPYGWRKQNADKLRSSQRPE